MQFYKPSASATSIDSLFDRICGDIIHCPLVDTGHWQAKKEVPQTQTREMLNFHAEVPIASSVGAWASYMKPNLPWADEHFAERVGGVPVNPPPSASHWPYAQKDNADFKSQGAFSHSYPERLWSKWAPIDSGPLIGGYGHPPQDHAESQTGIRYPHGDLDDAVALLVNEPFTRQCYIPMWFAEDLHAAAVEHERVPCSLGWHFILRRGKLQCFYPMRSLDLLRYFRDDLYMAGRLCQWMIQKCRIESDENSVWHEISPGALTVHAVSLHIFDADVPGIKHRLAKKQSTKVEVIR